MALQLLHEIAEIGEDGVVQVPVPVLCRHAKRKVRVRFRRQPGTDARFLGSVNGGVDAREIIADTSIFSGSREGLTEESFERSRLAPLLPLASV